MIRLILALDENYLIGKDNRLPWHLPKDLAFLKKMTQDQTVLMGHMTYISLKSYYKNKPLPFKKMYVCNVNDMAYEDAIIVKDIDAFLKDTEEDLFVIGGKMIYQLSLPYADQLYITHILNRYEGNVYFPLFDLNHFKVKSYHIEDGMIFTTYERIDNHV